MNKSESKIKKITELVKTVPNKLEGEIRFPSLSAESDQKGSYDLISFAKLESGLNQGKLISAKVVMHLPKE